MKDVSRYRRALAITSTLAVATLGVAGNTAAAADPDKSRGHAHGKADHKPDRLAPQAHPGKGKGAGQGKGQGKSRGRSAGAPHGSPGHQSSSASGSHAGGKPGHAGQHGQAGSRGGQGGQQERRTDPPGNNGTVKITPIGEDDGIPQNTPHVPCGFDVEWYGFDEGPHIVSEVVFESWAPTAVPMTVDGPSEVFVGGDPASGAGTDSGFDGEATYTLSFDGDPHPKQGYHVKLTIHTPGSQGADTKHKVFWVGPCEEQATQPGQDDTGLDDDVSGQLDEQDASPEGEDELDVLGVQETAPGDEGDLEVLGVQETAPGDEGDLEVLGVEVTRGVPTAVAAGAGPAERLGSALALLLVLLGGLAAAAGVAFRRRTA